MKTISLGLNEDLAKTVQGLATANCILVFPTRIAANLAARDFAPQWDLEQRSFISVEELQEALILPEYPALMDEKRLLCLYLVMSEADKQFFHIFSYGDIVDWGKRFFDFFGELADECIDIDTLPELNSSGTFHLQEWQEVYLTKLLQIRFDYASYISALGFTDSIFYKQTANIQVPWTDFDIIYVNQYYYSALEKAQITALEDSGNRVYILMHGLEISGSGAAWKMQEFDLKAAWASLATKPQIQVLEAENEDQMALAFLARQKDISPYGCAIIDSGFHNKSYSRFFTQPGFPQSKSYPFCESSVYQMLSAIAKGIAAYTESRGFLPIKLLSRLISADWFLRYLIPGSAVERESAAAIVRNELAAYISNDFLYIDPLLFQDKQDSLLKLIVEGFYALISAYAKVKSITTLCQIMDTTYGLILDKVLSENEKTYTDTLSCFWERVANFLAIEQLSLISAWPLVFPPENLGQNILELLLSYLKTASVCYSLPPDPNPTWEITNLLDSRNRNFATVAFFQLVEGIIPSSPTPVWLFSETQRAKLGLKTYADIRTWERYYFFRLILSSKQSLCFSYRNLERDINPSSFLGEMEQLILTADPSYPLITKFQLPISSLYVPSEPDSEQFYPASNNILVSDPAYNPISAMLKDKTLCCQDMAPPPEFFIIPAKPEQDFPQYTASLGASGLISLLKNPFIWFVEYHSQLQHQDFEAEETISPKLFGNIMHAYFSSILGELAGQHHGLAKLQALFGNPEYLEKALQELIVSHKFRYSIPKNYNADFLSDILAQRLSNSLFQFYTEWVKQHLEARSFTLIPETDTLSEFELGYKRLGTVLSGSQAYHLQIRGKADLRIELENAAMIVDFKTGNHDSRQLALYEWFYYLLDESLPQTAVSSLFWDILGSAKPTQGITPEQRIQLKADILQTYLSVLSAGFTPSAKAAERTRLKDITRADLMIVKREVTNA